MDDLRALEGKMGVTFRSSDLLRRALTHASYLNEHSDCPWGDNERLEFLGDAVGDFLAAEHLYHLYPDRSEGELTALRAELVRSETLARFSSALDLGAHLLLSRGEEQGGGRDRASMLADAFEALLGALYLDQGLAAARRFFLPFLESRLPSSADASLPRDAKTRLQEWAQAVYHATPDYVSVLETGPDHDKEFTAEVRILGEPRGRGTGSSKQAAEQAAAQAALDKMAAE
jgi:ribonuclease-3